MACSAVLLVLMLYRTVPYLLWLLVLVLVLLAFSEEHEFSASAIDVCNKV